MWLQLLCLSLAVCVSRPAAVFLGRHEAHHLLQRFKRANSGWFEELKMGNLERECLEEKCSYEEARETFEHEQATEEFWKTYNVQDHCHSNPCQNNGTCTSQSGSSYTCFCIPPFSGRNCELVFKETPDNCLHRNGGCEHFCQEADGERRCSCADGYALDVDRQHCLSQEKFPCGKVPVLQNDEANGDHHGKSLGRIVGGTVCPRGHCPWQVLLMYADKGFCGGIIYKPDWVLTATHCLENKEAKYLKVVVGEHDLEKTEGSEQVIQVAEIVKHQHYNAKTSDNDIALLRLRAPIVLSPYAVPVCLPRREMAERELWAVTLHTVSGWGRRSEHGPTSQVLRQLQVPRIRTAECVEKSGVKLTINMFCAGYFEGRQDSCKGDSGGPLVTRYLNTSFLLGIVSWGKGCAQPGNYGIYTRVSNYLDWIHLHAAPANRTASPTLASRHTPNHTVV
ncbi:coagulation factor VII-like [Paramormyrops kingsleyae]|uniref:Coagulation factor VII n=1 Tax=Paramormyrops kingsleyae TaxID=1676925 RepID=A0A3B3SAU4_9TELE|nr:coagulation factor VII-like [Paramormyrops kingsleyae]